MPIGILYYNNYKVVLINRKLTITNMQTLQPLIKVKVSGTYTNLEYKGGIKEEFIATTIILTIVTLTKYRLF